MQHKIDEMGNRIHELEEALKASHAKNSHVQHPLLAENLLSIKSSAVDTSQHNVEEESDDTLDGETMAAFGKLSISEDATELLGLPLVVCCVDSHSFDKDVRRQTDAWLAETSPHLHNQTLSTHRK
jgi:hypothetical protein